jgi:hypothetical protein
MPLSIFGGRIRVGHARRHGGAGGKWRSGASNTRPLRTNHANRVNFVVGDRPEPVWRPLVNALQGIVPVEWDAPVETSVSWFSGSLTTPLAVSGQLERVSCDALTLPDARRLRTHLSASRASCRGSA